MIKCLAHKKLNEMSVYDEFSKLDLSGLANATAYLRRHCMEPRL